MSRSLTMLLAAAAMLLGTAHADAGDPAGPDLVWIRQHAKADVGGLRLTLGDVAEVDALDPKTAARLRAIDLGEIPAKARQLMLSRETLSEALARSKASGEVLWDGPAVTHVELRLLSLSGEEIAALGRRHVAGALGSLAAEATFGPSAPPAEFQCVAGRWSTRVLVRHGKGERFSGAVRLELVAIVDGVERAALPFMLDVERKGSVLVATRDLTAGSPLKAGDVTPVERNLAAVGPDTVDSPERVVGMVLARRVPAGQALSTRDFRLPAVIERDDVVQVRYSAGALKVSGLGRAQAAGAPGERIPILNLTSRKVVHAIVVDSRTVEVKNGLPDPGGLP